MFKIVCIADTHSFHNTLQVPDGDILIFAGDMSISGEPAIMADADAWLAAQPHRYVFGVPGNHDIGWTNPNSRVHWLNHESINIEGLNIFGSPITPAFGKSGAFMAKRGPEIAAKWAEIPTNTDILITHGPPLGILDTFKGEHVGCADLLAELNERLMPLVHIFGHIHPGHGVFTDQETVYANASICINAPPGVYIPGNPPISIELPFTR